MEQSYRIKMTDIQKRFAGVHALKGASLQVCAGEIHALIGENGAGKSTLMKILAGAIRKDAGEIWIDGRKTEIQNPRDAHKLGIATIYQEFMLAPDLTVAENIFVENLTSGRKLINWKTLNKSAQELLDNLGFGDIDPAAKVGTLSVAYQQVVEICKSLSQDVKVLILDEPTAVLTFREIEKLFELLVKLKEDGVSIIYISHRLEEIFRLCDQITVMKDGCFVRQVRTDEIHKEQLINLMVGRDLKDIFPKRDKVVMGDKILQVQHLRAGSRVQDVSFDVRAGEVVGFYGLVGAGRTETMRAVFGADPVESGKILWFGEEVRFKNPLQAVKRGLGMVPEDRKKQGLVLEQSIEMNTTITSMKKVQNRARVFSKRKEEDFTKEVLESIHTKYASVYDRVSQLSGGNQQKVALAKWLAARSKCIIFDEPTRGVDVGAKTEIYNCINQLTAQGIGIIMISSEMPELMGMSDQVIVMRQGKVTGKIMKNEFSENNLIRLAMGGA